MRPAPHLETGIVRLGVRVTLGWMDGRMETRTLPRFAPAMATLPVETESGTAPELVQIERLSYVAFLRVPGRAPAQRPEGLRRVRVHVPGGKRFLVDADPAAHARAGFAAYPCDLASPFDEIHFYPHGVNAVEDEEPLGTLLMQQVELAAEDVVRGLNAQSAPLGQILVEQQRVSPEAVEAAVTLQERRRIRVGEVLVDAGLATKADIDAALAEQAKRRGKRLGEILVDMGLVSEAVLAETLARKFHLRFVDLDHEPRDPAAIACVPEGLIQRYGFLPIALEGKTLTVAISDPLNAEIADVLRFHLRGRKVVEVLATKSQLDKAVKALLLRGGDEEAPEEMDQILRELSADEATEADHEAEEQQIRESDSAVIKLANQIILDALRRGASDVHVEPRGADKNMVVRFRVDGECSLYREIPAGFRAPLVARLKIMADLDIAERRKPQDGKIRFKVRDRRVELRVATIPTVSGVEDVALRILATAGALPIEKLGMSERNVIELRALIEKPYGLLLCVGPTGSGKTTTLHSMLGAINNVDRKIWTAEDPVEITQDGLRQVQVQPKVGFDFAAAMRAFLRADPDVIMVGEMRDRETASIAVEASLTGHLVLSTLHTNTAPETITRLIDMGLDPFSFADALLGTLAQRLARKLCDACKHPYEAGSQEWHELAAAYGEEQMVQTFGIEPGPDFRLWRAGGCDACGGTGYRGRLALHELLVATDPVKEAISRKASVPELRRLAAGGGMTTLMQDGIAKVLAGRTDLRQVLAVCTR